MEKGTNYPLENLNGLKLTELKELGKKVNINTKGNRDEIKERLAHHLSKRETNSDEIKVFNLIATNQKYWKSQVHELYKNYFNSEDKFNKTWMKLIPKITFKNWRTKVLISLLLQQLMNARSLYCNCWMSYQIIHHYLKI